MPWQALILFQNLGSAWFTLSSRSFSRQYKNATWPLNIIVFGVIACSGLLASVLLSEPIEPGAIFQYLPFFMIEGVCFALTNALAYKVITYVDAAVASVFFTFNIIASIVFATVFLDEGLTFWQLIGAALLLTSIYTVLFVKVDRIHRKNLHIAAALSIIAAVCFAGAVTAEKYLLNNTTLSTYLLFGWSFQFLWMCIFGFFIIRHDQKKTNFLRNRTFIIKATKLGLIRMVSGGLFILSLVTANNLSIISTLAGFKIVLVAVFGAVFLKENKRLPVKLAAAACAMIGVAILSI